MMGGLGSGNRWRSSGATCEGKKRIDLKYLKKRGWLQPGNRYYLSWNLNGEPIGNINYTAYEGHLLLDFKVRDYGEEEWTPITQIVRFDHTHVHFGGQRQWLICPRCQRRCRILYGGGRFYCRKCYRLNYQSQAEDSAQRAITRAQATRKRLGGFEGIDDPFPLKPKGMHWKTYNKLAEADDQVGQRLEAAMMGFIAKFDRFKR
jgi:hypothetical protein